MDHASTTNRLITPSPKQTHTHTDKQIDRRSTTGETDLELLAEMETNSLPPTFPRFDQRFLEHLQVCIVAHPLLDLVTCIYEYFT